MTKKNTTDSKADAPKTDTTVQKEPAEKTFRFVLHSQEGPMGKEPGFISVNGKAWHIPRDEEVIIPHQILHAIENANYTVLDDKNKERTAKRFVYTASEITQ